MLDGVRSSLQVWERIFFRIVLGLLCLLILLGLWFSRVGLPQGLANALMRRIDTGAFAMEADTIRISLLKGVRLGGAAVYRRGLVGPPAAEAAEVILRVDPLAFLRGVGKLQRLEIRDGELRPEMILGGLSGSGDRSLGAQQTDVRVERCRVQGVTVEALQAHLVLSGTIVRADDVRLALARDGLRGSASGGVQYDGATGLLTGHVNVVMNPHLALPVLRAWNVNGLADLFERFTFSNALPQGALDFEVDCVAGGRIGLEGSVHLREATYRGVEAAQADAVLQVEIQGSNTVVTLNPLSVVRRDGAARGLVVLDLLNDTVRFDAHSTLNPHLFRKALGILQEPFWEEWTFDGPVNLDARGVVEVKTLEGTDFTAVCDATRLRYKKHPLDRCRFNMHMTDRTNVLSSVHAELYGGEVSGAARFVLPAASTSNTVIDVALKMKDLDFERVADVLIGGGENEYRGRLSGELALRGPLGAQNSGALHGNGLINIDDGRVFMLPLFGGLSEIMTRLIPGLDFVLRQSDAFTEFRIKDSRVISDKVEIEGSVLSLSANGYCQFDKVVDFHVQLKLMKDNNVVAKLVRLVTFPISKLLEFRLRGSLDDPRWYPVNFSGDLLENLGLRKGDS